MKAMWTVPTLALFLALAPAVYAQDVKVTRENVPVAVKPYSPYAGRAFPTLVLWGDTHLHTSNSLDARAMGATLGPEEAFRFARGDEVISSHGERVRLSRPLDFLVVADHSDAMGAMNEIVAGNPDLMRNPTLRDWHERINQGGTTAVEASVEIVYAFAGVTGPPIPDEIMDPEFVGSVWRRYLDTAEQYNDPGRFTALIGYEWTSTEGGNNLHRNVIYRDGADLARRMNPLTVAEGFNPESLWRWMATYEETTGGRVLALAHNGNLSNGIMFPDEINPATGQPLTGDYARNRIRWEPLYEITQIKGDGETHPLLSPNDEFADYGTWDKNNLGPFAKTRDMIPREYAREALKNGLLLEDQLGTNPYKFGVVGSTDSHTTLATAEEENFFGKVPHSEPSAHRMTEPIAEFTEDLKWMGWEAVASGYAAVWATENTREAIFDAMRRKEVYGTTGPRMTVRFFGGWDFESADASNRLPGAVGYTKGVPMGGDLMPRPRGASPTFLVAALKDPYSGNLDRIQIVKGWLDSSGETQERVYDVVWSDADSRRPGADGKLPAVGNTVDVENATWTNTIGAPELITVWEDPDFNPTQGAFYYARVLEIPTPFWTAYDALRYDIEIPVEAPRMNQERAYTSPIWYTPGG
jgi:hypothetical protein